MESKQQAERIAEQVRELSKGYNETGAGIPAYDVSVQEHENTTYGWLPEPEQEVEYTYTVTVDLYNLQTKKNRWSSDVEGEVQTSIGGSEFARVTLNSVSIPVPFILIEYAARVGLSVTAEVLSPEYEVTTKRLRVELDDDPLAVEKKRELVDQVTHPDRE